MVVIQRKTLGGGEGIQCAQYGIYDIALLHDVYKMRVHVAMEQVYSPLLCDRVGTEDAYKNTSVYALT
jgi:hypothetical protein